MARPAKIPDDQIIALIRRPCTYAETCKELGSRLSWTRFEKLKEKAEAGFDLQKGDTVSKGLARYGVTEITEDVFTIKEIQEYDGQPARVEEVKKEDYMSGKSGLIKRDLPPVTFTNIKDLEEKKMGVVMNKTTEFEHEKVEAVNDIPLPVPFDPTAELAEDIKRRDETILCLEQKIKELEKQVAEKDGAVSAYQFALQCLAGGEVNA